jgi:cyclohexyl-isocyanide hydratase
VASVPADQHLHIGLLLFPQLDQLDFTGPFEVLSRTPNATLHIVWKDTAALKDMMGLILTPTISLKDCPQLDAVVVPGGFGQQALMEDAEVLGFLRRQAKGARYVCSVCTGSLVLGAAGLLKGYRATTHWASAPLLPLLGATRVDERVVVDRNRITAAGVSSGIDGALQLLALLRGDTVAQEIQLYMEYAPAPPFAAGSPRTAPAEILQTMKNRFEKVYQARSETCKRVAARLGL